MTKAVILDLYGDPIEYTKKYEVGFKPPSKKGEKND